MQFNRYTHPRPPNTHAYTHKSQLHQTGPRLVRFANPARGPLNRGKRDTFLSPLAPENLVLRDRLGVIPSRVSPLILSIASTKKTLTVLRIALWCFISSSGMINLLRGTAFFSFASESEPLPPSCPVQHLVVAGRQTLIKPSSLRGVHHLVLHVLLYRYPA